jgi:anthranilate/para-aminobenzoate synthase component I
LGLLFVVSLVLVVLFGLRLAQNNKIKDKEASEKLKKLEQQLKEEFQKEKEKEDFQYTADDIFGAFKFKYPKVWSTNITQEEGASEELIFLADPSLIVENKKDKKQIVALRVVVYTDKYENKLNDIEGENKDKGLLTESDVKVSDILGKKFIGKDEETGKDIAFVLVNLRDKTLYIGTDDYSKYKDQYEKILGSFNLSK